ncbi:hypothetical protein P3S67_017298 [Capsicum chacoense]
MTRLQNWLVNYDGGRNEIVIVHGLVKRGWLVVPYVATIYTQHFHYLRNHSKGISSLSPLLKELNFWI